MFFYFKNTLFCFFSPFFESTTDCFILWKPRGSGSATRTLQTICGHQRTKRGPLSGMAFFFPSLGGGVGRGTVIRSGTPSLSRSLMVPTRNRIWTPLGHEGGAVIVKKFCFWDENCVAFLRSKQTNGFFPPKTSKANCHQLSPTPRLLELSSRWGRGFLFPRR